MKWSFRPLLLIIACWSEGACGDGRHASDASVDSREAVADGNGVAYLLTIHNEGGGSIASTDAAIGCGLRCSTLVAAGQTVVLVATPNPSFEFGGWDGDCTGTGPCTLVMDRERSVVAAFWPPRFSWLAQTGGTGHELPARVAVDPAGDVLVLGEFAGEAELGGAPFPSAGDVDVFLAKYRGGSGQHVWSRAFGGPGPDDAFAIAVDAAGSSVITGRFWGTAWFGTATLTSAGASDAFLAKVQPDGALAWAIRLGGDGSESSRAVAVDGAGNILVVGAFDGRLNLGGGELVSAGTDIFVAKYAGTDGAHLWSRRFGGVADQFALALAADSQDDLVLAGYYRGTLDLGGGLLPDAGSGSRMFVAKLTPDGAHMWSRAASGYYVHGYAVATDAADDVTVAGIYLGNADLGGGPLPPGYSNIFVAKYAGTDGRYAWARGFGGQYGGELYVHGLAVGAGGSLAITGFFIDAIDFGGGALVSRGESDLFVAALRGSDGAQDWAVRFGGDGDFPELGAAIAPTGTGLVLAAGLAGVIDLGGRYLSSRGGSADVFLLRMAP